MGTDFSIKKIETIPDWCSIYPDIEDFDFDKILHLVGDWMYLGREVVLEVVVVDSDFDLNFELFSIQCHHYNRDRDCV